MVKGFKYTMNEFQKDLKDLNNLISTYSVDKYKGKRGGVKGESSEHSEFSESEHHESSHAKASNSAKAQNSHKGGKRNPNDKREFRRFQVMMVNGKPVKNAGRYKIDKNGGRPKSAASRAFGKLCKAMNLGGACKLNFVMRETTRGSSHKEREYKGYRKVLNPPKYITRKDGSKYKVEFDPIVTRVSENNK